MKTGKSFTEGQFLKDCYVMLQVANIVCPENNLHLETSVSQQKQCQNVTFMDSCAYKV